MSRGKGESREQRLRGNEEAYNKEFSVFVENISLDLDKYGLKGIFSRAGRVSDVYIPIRAGRRTGRRFGFVRFWRREDALRSILLFNNYLIRGRRIKVCEAKFGKGRQRPTKNTLPAPGFEPRVKKIWRKKVNQDNEKEDNNDIRLSQEENSDVKHLKGEICRSNLEWLGRSLVCSSDSPRDLGAIAAALNADFPLCTKVSALSKFKFILTFQTIQEMEDILQRTSELEQWFTSIKKWDIYDTSDTRRTWIEVLGIPPHGWKWENFKRIADLWGRFVCLDSNLDNPESFESMKILIDTNHFNNIDGGLVLDLEDCGYRVKVREVQYVYKSTGQHHTNMVKNVEFWPGFEDVSSDEHSGKCDQEQMAIEEGNPSKGSHERGEQGVQISNPLEDEQPRENSGFVSSSRTESATYVGIINQEARTGTAFTNQPLNEGSLDSEETLGNSHPTQHVLNDNLNEFSLGNSMEFGCWESPINMDDEVQKSPRRRTKAKAKKKNSLKQKCMLIQKKIKKKQSKKQSRPNRKEITSYDSFIEEARRMWETTKAIGLATKGQDEEVVEKIAMNLAEEAEERKSRDHQ